MSVADNQAHKDSLALHARLEEIRKHLDQTNAILLLLVDAILVTGSSPSASYFEDAEKRLREGLKGYDDPAN